MVKANGDPTRTRDRKRVSAAGFSETLKIDAAHRFLRTASDFDKLQREQHLTSVKARVQKLSPAAGRVLAAVRTAMLLRCDPGKGYVFQAYVNRAAVARVLGREKLVPYDIRILRQLCTLRLLEELQHPLPRKQYGEIWLGAGAEFVYTIPLDTLFALLYLDPQERPRLLALKPRTQPTRKVSSVPDRDVKALLEQISKREKRTLWERMRDWIGF